MPTVTAVQKELLVGLASSMEHHRLMDTNAIAKYIMIYPSLQKDVREPHTCVNTILTTAVMDVRQGSVAWVTAMDTNIAPRMKIINKIYLNI